MPLNIEPTSTVKMEKQLSIVQKITAILAMVFGTISVILTLYYCKKNDTQKNFLGGLNYKDKIFNWHPAMMVMGMIFFFVNAAMTYRVLPFGHDINKVLHICFHTAAVVCVSFGLYAVFRSNNKYPYDTYTDDGTKKDVYYSNLYSSHSFVGISAIVLFYQNYILGLVIFFIGSPELKRNYLSNHIKLGMLAMITALAAVEAGVMELATEYSCGYQSYNPDYNPAANYHKESAGCKNLNGIAITVLITVLCAVFTLVDTPEPTTSANEKLLSP